MSRPNIQIDDEVREMTEEEYANFLAVCRTLENEPIAAEPPA
jgi:hypothetical protein